MVKIHHRDENSLNIKNQHCDQNSSLSWEFSIVITFMTTIGQILHYDKNSSVWWKFIIVMKIHHRDTNSWFNKIHHCDENSSILSELIVVMKIHLDDEIDHYNKNFINWWLFLIVIKMNKTMKIHHGHINSSLDENLYLW